ncbi:MAG: Hsp20/alpha crystallin family protein [Phycisphaerae bacterium]|nr:Hsp20/alpha crystallin family protein [Phycisphaerae bacterium]MDW8261375.1 Hsp20/alpha crystallin family protein [Phycisphaerales bacterium]
MMVSRILNEFEPLFRIQEQMSRVFDTVFNSDLDGRRFAADYPALNVWEDPDGQTAYVEAELPGMSIDQIEVSVLGNELTISGERRIGSQNEPQQRFEWLRRERGQGRFSRTITLPWEIDQDHVQARLRDGVLSITLPKSESARPKKVKLLTA